MYESCSPRNLDRKSLRLLFASSNWSSNNDALSLRQEKSHLASQRCILGYLSSSCRFGITIRTVQKATVLIF